MRGLDIPGMRNAAIRWCVSWRPAAGSACLRTDGELPETLKDNVYIADTTGELRDWTALADYGPQELSGGRRPESGGGRSLAACPC